ncbi:MAG: hypothetical protein K1X53_04065 [Candidatus Sumerlaeaceae bacterium]|nr:hypothetical protein [Candidatus Sumerlaeaceae bacterium]
MRKVMMLAATLAVVVAPAFAAKTYQVTGPVIEVSDKVIVIDKSGEKHEITRNAATKVEGGDIQPGSKATVVYEMVATKVEVKSGPAAASTQPERGIKGAKDFVKDTGAVAGSTVEKTGAATGQFIKHPIKSTESAVKKTGEAIENTAEAIVGDKKQ